MANKTLKKITWSDTPIQVESAIRDGGGHIITSYYQPLNAKLTSFSNLGTGTGFVKISNGTVSIDTTTYLTSLTGVTDVQINSTSIVSGSIANISSIPWSIISSKPTIGNATISIYNDDYVIGSFNANQSSNKDIVLPRIPSKATDVNDYTFQYVNPTQVRQFQTIFGIAPTLLTNINGHDLSSTYNTTNVTVNGYPAVKIRKASNNANLTFNDSHNYMRKITGSEFTPIFGDGTVPQYSYIIDGSGNLYKPQWDSTNGLLLYKVNKLALSSSLPATNVIPSQTTANKLLLSTSTGGTATWSSWSSAGFLKTNSSGVVSVDTNSYLTTSGTAADSSKLGGVAASSYATQTWVNNKGYTTNTGTVTSVSAGTGLSISGTASTTPTVNIASGYKLPTTSEWNALPTSNTTYTIAEGTDNGKIKVTPSSGSAYQVSVHGLGAAAYKGTTTSVTSGSADLITSGGVFSAISNLPTPMQFKGTLGTNGTITTLPTVSAANNGYTYKVITAGTYASQSAKVGDVFVSNGSSWILIPSGDESFTDTWRGINVNETPLLGSAISTGEVNFKNGGNITVSGSGNNITLGVASGYSIPSTTKQSEWDAKQNALSSLSEASGGTAVSLVTTGEKYTWNHKSDLALVSSGGTNGSATTAARSDHTHTTSLAVDTGTSSITLSHGGKYKLTAGGTSVIFTLPSDNNTNYYPTRSYTSGLQISSYSGSTDCQLYVPYATASQYGVSKPAAVRSSAITSTTGGTTSGRYYGVEMDSNGKLFVNVPWESSNDIPITDLR